MQAPKSWAQRPHGLDGDDWEHLTDAIDFDTHARVRRRLEQMRQRTVAEPPPCRRPP
ncbi:hypothetical protein ACWDFL_37805 [Streptomyces bungoensis]